MEVSAVFYTNDGESDNMTVSIDGTTLGIVETVEQYGKGTLWNEVRSSGSLEKEVLLRPGEHEFSSLCNFIRLKRSRTRQNSSGNETVLKEVVKISMKMPTSVPDSMIQMLQYVHTEEEQLKVLLSSSKNTLGLAGVIIGGCFGLINVVISLIVALLGCRRNRRGNGPGGRHERENLLDGP